MLETQKDNFAEIEIIPEENAHILAKNNSLG